jgi:hypothetical protein
MIGLCLFSEQAWGGSIVCACLLGLKPVQFLSPDPILAYSAIYLAVMVAFAILPSLESLVPYLDLPFLAVDALTRSKAIASTVQLAQRDMDYSTSSFAQTLLGMVSATAGGQIVSTFSMDEDEWRLRTPPFLKTVNLVDSLDLWSAALGAYIFGAFNAVRPSHARLYRKGMGDGLSMLATPDGAQAGVAGVLLACYAWRYAWRSFHSSRLVTWARARTETGQTVDQREVQALRDARKKGQ